MVKFTYMLWHSSIMIFYNDIFMLIHSDSMIFISIRRLVWRLSTRWMLQVIWIIAGFFFSIKCSERYKFNCTNSWHLWVWLSIFCIVILLIVFMIIVLNRHFWRNNLFIKNIIQSVFKQTDLLKSSLNLNWNITVM